ncbi:MAG: hypothetical protein ACPGWR_23230 [Ardenticatenaceae bacterium]
MSELESFVLGYVEEIGGVVEPVGLAMHEVVIPDEVADMWGVPAYQSLAFSDSAEAEEMAFTRVSYNHSLVEQMVETARTEPACTRFYVNGLRLNKKGLAELAQESWTLPNARVVTLAHATVARTLTTYIRFNFKAACVSDEKQEQLVSVLMDAQGGNLVADPDTIYLAATSRLSDPVLNQLSQAPVRWKTAEGERPKGPLTPVGLQELLSRAQKAVLQSQEESLSQLQQRSNRFRELDEARLNEYYDEIEQDLRQRLANASLDRRVTLEGKLANIASERAAKLADVAERYQVHLELTLLNLMVIYQPKQILRVGIQNRATKIETYAVWDPLRHDLEGLACGVCHQTAQHLYLCHNGHLAHEDCLAPACMDCKRVFCTTCANDVGECDVCHQPLCRHSRITCSKCGKGTCHAHRGHCHASKSEAVEQKSPTSEAKSDATAITSEAQTSAKKKQSSKDKPSSEAKAKPKAAAKATSKPSTPPKATSKPTSKRSSSKKTPSSRRKVSTQRRAAPKKRQEKALAQRIEVVSTRNAVEAYVLGTRDRTIAQRTWIFERGEGISVSCFCEKRWLCSASGNTLRPANKDQILMQMRREIDKLRKEYGLTKNKIVYNRMDGKEYVQIPYLLLIGYWNNERQIRATQAAYDRYEE